MNRLILLLFFLISHNIFSQVSSSNPSIGYVYPAGGCKGTTFDIIVGGQNLRGARSGYFSTDKIKVLQIQQVPNLNPMQKRLLIKNIREIIAYKLGRMKKNPEISYEKDGIKLPNHPLLKDLENKTVEELKKITEIFLTPYRTEQIKRSIQEKVILKIEISPEIEHGIYELRLVTVSGITNFLNFYVDEVPEINEDEKVPFFQIFNPEKKTLELPIIINGQITPGDIDRFYFKAKKGQKLLIELKGREIIPFMADAVPGWFQATLTLYDSTGKEITYVDDYYFNPDPIIFFEVPEDGEYCVEVKDALFRGREDFVYRLFIGEKPFITHIFPTGGKIFEDISTFLYGWNIPVKTIKLESKTIGIHKKILNLNGLYSNFITYMIGELPEIIEKEPNDTLEKAMLISIPQFINGKISNKNDVDIFKFKVSKGEKIAFEVFSRRLGYPVDSFITLFDSKGNILTYNDDYYDKSFDLLTHHADSYILYEFEKDGIYYLKINDIQGNGGDEYIYRLRIEKANPDFKIFAVPSALNIPYGGTLPFFVYVIKKDGFCEDIELSLENSPSGLILSGNKIPKNKEKMILTLSSDPEFKLLNTPISLKIVGIANINGKIIKKEVIPTDEMMQAFAYFHLVPSKNFIGYVYGRPKFPKIIPVRINNNYLKIPCGGKIIVEGIANLDIEKEKLTFEIKNPEQGVFIENIKVVDNKLTFDIKLDPKFERGFLDNLIIQVFIEKFDEKKQEYQKISVGYLPAITMEVI